MMKESVLTIFHNFSELEIVVKLITIFALSFWPSFALSFVKIGQKNIRDIFFSKFYDDKVLGEKSSDPSPLPHFWLGYFVFENIQ